VLQVEKCINIAHRTLYKKTENFLIHRCNYIFLSQVYCVRQVVKTPTIILITLYFMDKNNDQSGNRSLKLILMTALQSKWWLSKRVHQIISTTETKALNLLVSQSKETKCKTAEVSFNMKIFSLKQLCSEFEEKVMNIHPKKHFQNWLFYIRMFHSKV
jgi:hypothetical protein